MTLYRRAFVALLALTVLTGAFAGGDQEPDPSRPTTITLVTPGTPQADQAMVNQAVSDYLRDDLNIELDYQQVDWAGWGDRNNLIIASGEDVDLLYTAGWTGYATNAAKGAFVDLTDMIPEIAPELFETDYAWTFDAARIGGRIYSVPTYQMLAQSRGFFLRGDLVDEYAPAGWTIDPRQNDPRDLEPMFDAILENEPGMVPWYAVPGKMLRFMGPFDTQGSSAAIAIEVTDEIPVVKNIFATEWYQEMMVLSREWFEKGYINSDAATTTETGISKVSSGVAFSYSSQTNVGADLVASRSSGFPIVMYPVLPPIVGTALVQGAMFSVLRQSDNPELALEFVSRMHTDANVVNMLTYGIEGTHYAKLEENLIGPAPGIDETKNPYLNLVWMFGNQALLYDYGEEGRGAAEALREFNDTAIQSAALGFSFDPEPVKTELAAISNVVSEYDPVIASGAVDATQGLYEEFLHKLRGAGIDTVLAAANQQLTDWMAETR